MKIQVTVEGLKTETTHHVMLYADDINLLGKYMNTTRRARQYFLLPDKKTHQEVKAKETNYRPEITLCIPTLALK
jgi:hypothetical protein